jgi:hypothetical protein
MKYATPLTFLAIFAVIDLLLFLLLDPAFWEAHLAGTMIVFGIVMACGAAFAMGPVIFARKTERFLLGSRRTNWLLDEEVEIFSGEFWTHPFHLPRNGWLGVRCTSNAPISVEILDSPNYDRMLSRRPYRREESRKSAKNLSVYHRAGHEGDWVLLIHNNGLSRITVRVKVSALVSSWSRESCLPVSRH